MVVVGVLVVTGTHGGAWAGWRPPAAPARLPNRLPRNPCRAAAPPGASGCGGWTVWGEDSRLTELAAEDWKETDWRRGPLPAALSAASSPCHCPGSPRCLDARDAPPSLRGGRQGRGDRSSQVGSHRALLNLLSGSSLASWANIKMTALTVSCEVDVPLGCQGARGFGGT